MPLDGHSYLISQGWAGKGSGLRHGAIIRPLAIPQKKTLAGLGKDRDEAFPFWDHLFSAAAKSIQIKVTGDDKDHNESDSTTLEPIFKRTATGILSNRRPIIGTPASTSGTTTPDAGDRAPQPTLLSVAKRDAARCGLYAKFFRGPVLVPNSCDQNDSKVINAEGALDPLMAQAADIEHMGGTSAKLYPGDDDVDEKRRRKKERKESRDKQKKKQKASKESDYKGKETAQEDQKVWENNRRRKREAEAGEDSARKIKRKKEKTANTQMTLELDEVEIPHVSLPRKKKRRKEFKDDDGLERSKSKRKDVTI